MSDGEQSGKSEGYRLESDAFKFASWLARRGIHAVSGRRFGTLELDEQLGTAVHAVVSQAQPTVGAGARIATAATGAAWRAIRDIARNLDVTDLEIERIPSSSRRQPDSKHSANNQVSGDGKEGVRQP